MAGQRRLATEPKMVWTKASTADPVFHPMTQGVPARGIVKARPTLVHLEVDTGDVEVSVAYQVSNADTEDDWDDDTPTNLSGSYVSTSGLTYTSSYTDISSGLTKRLVRFGLNVKNKTVSDVDIVLAAFAVDIRED